MIFKSNNIKYFWITFLFCILLFMLLYAFIAGNYDISSIKTFSIFTEKIFGFPLVDTSNLDKVIIWDIRLPRIIMAILAGIALSTAGASYQGCFRNPLVEPFILGVSSGAAFGAALGILFPQVFITIQISAFIFSMLAVTLSYFLAKNRNKVAGISLVLSGVIVGSIFSALVSILKYMSEDTQLREITFWMMGGLYYSTWSDIPVNLVIICICFIVVWFFSWKLNILSMGDYEAKSLGVSPEKYRALFIVVATLMTSICVSTVGIITWVGLMMPHAARLIVGPDNRFVIPVAGIMGAIYLIFCDTLSRTISSAEIPIGIITSIVGAPFLLWLLRTKSKGMFS